jgi:prepilin-type N-terminal cleavage/methylation domain-containing protein
MEKKRGFTLIEVLVTLALFALLMTLVSSAITNALRFHRQGIERARLKEKAQELLKVLSTELMASNEFGAVTTNIYTTSGSSISFLKTDINESAASQATGGNLIVSYSLDTATGNVIRLANSTSMCIMNIAPVADNVKALKFSSTDPGMWMIDIDVTVVTDFNDPGSTSFSLSTSVCRRGIKWEFGP